MNYQTATTELHAARFAARVIDAVTEWDLEPGDETADVMEALWECDHCPREIAIRDERLAGLLM
jgi:hypothetical protein